MARLAISHDWLLTPRGAERVLCEFCRAFSDVSIYTLFCDTRTAPSCVRSRVVHVSPLNRFPFVHRYYRYLLPLYRTGLQQLYVRDADLLLSISHSIAKGIRRASGIPHVCYCLTPARYIWEPELYGTALSGRWKTPLVSGFSNHWKAWDLAANHQVDHFVAISRTVQARIEKHYGRSADIIHPCVDLDFYRCLDRSPDGFYLIVSALVPQKRIDLAIRAFTDNGRTLVIAGDGPLRGTFERMAGSNIRLLGWQSDDQIRELYNRARALVFPGTEDFGLVPVEAQACGCPVIAHRSGGAMETVVDEDTGVFFAEAEPDALTAAVERFERMTFDRARATRSAARFSRAEFSYQWGEFWKRIGFRAA